MGCRKCGLVWCVRAGAMVRAYHEGCNTELVEMQLCGEEQFVGRAELAYHQGPKRNEVSPCAEEVDIDAD